MAARPLTVIDRASFDEILRGWIDAAGRGLLQIAVVLFEVGSGEQADALAGLLCSSLRCVDVIGRYDLTSVAVILDADPEGTVRCIDRVQVLASSAGIAIEVSATPLPARPDDRSC